ncbi:hypothetical protein SARC_01789 [Sphaeroforma arctica JP610]|uniref:L-ornithine N(5)-monooxygenase [NAD(P)H] n=1 Tax=Sphaeroforma arctica JP610 TaxID=667725 RepID=A0A0L0GAN9_9EUKA|nr:hypothetical protein SARC_01789 [Sphaeroforma arctica JP610]KNC86067.1 hypothetical protein SARC_01789 [Sphaeroforma arctica JP610]|eukprot:XP_014159969.1 hypothetical protein SARC_01789 [Sphaeroforma arctica JP610]
MRFARMETLRTPKHVLGPDMSVPNLTVQAYYEALLGCDEFQKMKFLPREMWADYLAWFRRVIGIPVQNNTKVTNTTWVAEENCFHCSVDGQPDFKARLVVTATGIDGNGQWTIPPIVTENGLPKKFYAHTCENINYEALKGKKVGVLGAGASAFDNAAVAVESGAAQVHLFNRRPGLVTINVHRWAEHPGFLGHHADLPDEYRWKFVKAYLEKGQLPPLDTYRRNTKNPNFHLHHNSPWTSVKQVSDDKVQVVTPLDTYEFDFLVIGTGFSTDLSQRPELGSLHSNVQLWRDVYTPEKIGFNSCDEMMLRNPYLGPHFEYLEREKTPDPFLNKVFDFTFGALVSNGLSGSSISAMKYSVPRLVRGITQQLYSMDKDKYLSEICNYNEVELIDVTQKCD